MVSVAETDATGAKAGKRPPMTFEFDRVFGPASTQADVFGEIRPMVVSALDGYHACIFAYGQTGAGKSYTMSGPPSDRGVNYRTLDTLFQEALERQSGYEYTFKVRNKDGVLVPVYTLTPGPCPRRSTCWRFTTRVLWTCWLTRPPPHHLVLPRTSRWRSDRYFTPLFGSLSLAHGVIVCCCHWQGPFGLHVPDAVTEEVGSIADVETLMQRGEHNRTVGFTHCNERSSRSHRCRTRTRTVWPAVHCVCVCGAVC